ncbi:MarR family transcriptional regulator [Streptomyces sp. NPDC048417]|uniref:MarR family winged helix-turn-helix transcriptional regulator n=1 Tax=Streptomyces sp. NPDC048417 TaxID=3155387 RepID=UPI0034416A39
MDETSEEGAQRVAAALHELTTGLVRHIMSTWQGMSLTTAATLSKLGREGPVRLTTLAAAEGVTQPSMTVLVQRLEAQGLASRVSDPEDGRVRLVAITDAGRELLAEHRRAGDVRLAELLARLPEHDVQVLGVAVHTVMPIIRRMLGTDPRTAVKDGGGPPAV